MQERYLYEYAVIRVLPVVEREEFINVGIVLFCKNAKYISVKYQLNEARLASFSDELDIHQVKLNLESFEKIAMGAANCGPIAELDVPSRFRWLTAVRSSAIQTSRPHPGITHNLNQTAERLFTELVL
ncbi:MAG: DUF3037 domain-containing protein [Sphingobacteriales bacterium JAD_PAG50586_3]|nr:MAG: DUF3037 domain-containing protein [Sphingobacteriales bacterium JAD_PAG50586_3]